MFGTYQLNHVAVGVAVVVVTVVGILWPRPVGSHNPITTTVVFNREVAKVFEQKCTQCHAEGALAMSLVTYEEARPWAVAIKEEVLARRMPPWPGAHGFGDFVNAIGLTNREAGFLVAWADGGAPKGTMDPPLHLDHSGHWMLGSPDVVIGVQEGVQVEPDAPIGFKRIVFDPAFTEDRWIRAFDYKPGSRDVARAAVLRIAETGQYLGTWTPWRTAVDFPQGTAVRIPAGSQITVDALYQPASTGVTDRPQIGLYIAETAVTRPMRSIVMQPTSVEDRAPALRRVRSEFVLPDDTSLFELWPDMGPGAKSLELRVKRPDGSFHVLLWVQQFRRDWQTSYAFPQPFVVPKGSVLEAIAYFEGGAGAPAPRFALTFMTYDDTSATSVPSP